MWLGDDVWDESIHNAAVAWSACRGVRPGVIGCHRGDQSRTAVTTADRDRPADAVRHPTGGIVVPHQGDVVVNSNEMEFFNDEHQGNYCSPLYNGIGRFTWRVTAGVLYFTLISDDCDRAHVLTNRAGPAHSWPGSPAAEGAPGSGVVVSIAVRRSASCRGITRSPLTVELGGYSPLELAPRSRPLGDTVPDPQRATTAVCSFGRSVDRSLATHWER